MSARHQKDFVVPTLDEDTMGRWEAVPTMIARALIGPAALAAALQMYGSLSDHEEAQAYGEAAYRACVEGMIEHFEMGIRDLVPPPEETVH